MPRISADSIAEHVARQEAAVVDAAVALFAQRGYDQVGLGDIAAEVGLARNSLYRYFPDKTHILLAWFRREFPVQLARSAELLAGDGTPLERLTRWSEAQMDYARRPEHDLATRLAELAPGLDDAARAEVGESHRAMVAPLAATLHEAGVHDPVDVVQVAALMGGLVVAAAGQEARTGPDPRLRGRVARTIAALVADAS